MIETRNRRVALTIVLVIGLTIAMLTGSAVTLPKIANAEETITTGHFIWSGSDNRTWDISVTNSLDGVYTDDGKPEGFDFKDSARGCFSEPDESHWDCHSQNIPNENHLRYLAFCGQARSDVDNDRKAGISTDSRKVCIKISSWDGTDVQAQYHAKTVDKDKHTEVWVTVKYQGMTHTYDYGYYFFKASEADLQQEDYITLLYQDIPGSVDDIVNGVDDHYTDRVGDFNEVNTLSDEFYSIVESIHADINIAKDFAWTDASFDESDRLLDNATDLHNEFNTQKRPN